MVQLFLLLSALPLVCCYSSGRVTDSCSNMTPHHSGTSPQASTPPFTVTTDQSNISPGGEVTIHLRSSGLTAFAGFLLEARYSNGQTAAGSFAVNSADAQLLTCSQIPNSAVSHTSDSSKKSVTLTWKSEATTSVTSVQFHATFVQNFRTYWVDVKGSVLKLVPSGSSDVQSSVTSSSSDTVSRASCGHTKVCFSQPSDCDPSVTSQCNFMSAAMLSGPSVSVRYELIGPSNGYIAFGFSDDRKMGNDDIYVCGVGGDGQVKLQHAYSTGETTPETLPLGNVSDVQALENNGVLSCSFTTTNSISTQRSSGFNRSYYILFASGPSSNGIIQIHTKTFTSSQKIDITKASFVQSEGLSNSVRAHGALMLIAWMTTGCLGMMTARFLKGMAKGSRLCGKDMWFVVHVTLMFLTVAATSIAFIIIFSHARDWSGGAHPVLGCLVLILSLIQPLLALLRCGPQHPKRFLFNWIHSCIAVALKGLSLAAIFTGLGFLDTSWLKKVMGGFVFWEIVIFSLLELLAKKKSLQADSIATQMDSDAAKTDILLVGVYFTGNLPFLIALLVGIGTSQ